MNRSGVSVALILSIMHLHICSFIFFLFTIDSWIDVHSHCMHSPGRVTPPFVSAGEEYLRLLKEAQKDSNQSSARVSRANSNIASLKGRWVRNVTAFWIWKFTSIRNRMIWISLCSPKSPPNSPNTEPCPLEDLNDVYINYYSKVIWSYARVVLWKLHYSGNWIRENSHCNRLYE